MLQSLTDLLDHFGMPKVHIVIALKNDQLRAGLGGNRFQPVAVGDAILGAVKNRDRQGRESALFRARRRFAWKSSAFPLCCP